MSAAKISALFNLEDSSGNNVDSGKIQVLKQETFTATVGTQNSAMTFSTSEAWNINRTDEN